ncbi:hypothetical protein M3Y98_01171100 [Aphelenchoides besseyi]|nr:hypothetical protein M3Y98_01171100 [Aphelenchoides besseyi]KAI6210969.1 hypothetical protein M3Y96_00383800 [Aphelenchoides besseyi]
MTLRPITSTLECGPSTLTPVFNEKTIKRHVFIDGCNFFHKVGDQLHCLGPKDGRPRGTAALAIIYDFLRMGYPITFVIKKFHMDKRHVFYFDVLDRLRELKIVKVYPDKGVDDDLEILKEAQRVGGFVISNDQYSQEVYNPYDDVRKRTIGFYHKPDDRFNQYETPFTVDGRCKFDLKIRLKTSKAEFNRISTCSESDPEYALVESKRGIWTSQHLKQMLEEVTVIADYVRMQYVIVYEITYRKHHDDYDSPEKKLPYFDHTEEAFPQSFNKFYEFYHRKYHTFY